VGELKLDRRFVSRLNSGLGNGPRDEAIIRSTVELAHSLGLQVVAEGVERVELLGHLAQLGCDLAQGYAIAVPLPAEEIDLTSEALWPACTVEADA